MILKMPDRQFLVGGFLLQQMEWKYESLAENHNRDGVLVHFESGERQNNMYRYGYLYWQLSRFVWVAG